MFLSPYPTLEWALLFWIPFGISSDHRIGILKSTVITVAISRFWSWILLKCTPPPPTGELLLSCSVVSNSATPWTVARQGTSVHGDSPGWVAMPASVGSSHPRDWTQVSHIAGRFFTIWAIREAEAETPSHGALHRLHLWLSVLCGLLSLLRLCSALVRASLVAQW